MSKFSNLLKMLLLINSEKTIKAKELSEVLGVDVRMIRKYKSDLEEAGFHVESIRGKDGGYFISQVSKELFQNFTEHDGEVLSLANENLKKSNFIYSKEFEEIVERINKILNKNSNMSNNMNYYIKEYKSSAENTEQAIALKIHEAVIKKRKIKIQYFSLNFGMVEEVVAPYALFNYKSSIYFAGLCNESEEIEYFKLTRIKGDIELLHEEYEIPKDFSLPKYLHDNIDIFNDKEVNIKLKVFKPTSYIINEKIWSENQRITWNEDESITFEASIKGYEELKAWILSMGTSVEVLEPSELKEDIMMEINRMREIYKKPLDD
ncbi:helix-turn-helix transcriptional regulator [Hathewaya massiliensis]|uniref:helix-turn-helix transcriptional regulator n=1 Tax=Hathewaya massiliensis TaxID=1964382 RepID=UPI001156EC0D|nr:transcriptional regulator [Hathewaya massiliensis]